MFGKRKTNKVVKAAQDEAVAITDFDTGEKYIDLMGYDFKTKKKVSMFGSGIVDSFKVTRLVLESAVGTALSLVDDETFITEE